MTLDEIRKRPIVLLIIFIITNPHRSIANPSPQPKAQMQPQSPFSIPMHFPMGMGIGIAVVEEKISTTTTTTTAKPFIDKDGVLNIPGGIDNIAIALSVPQLPMQMPMGLPAPVMPFNMPMGFGIAVVQNEGSSTTTTITPAKPFTDKDVPGGVDNIAIALPMPPMSLPVPMGQPLPPPAMLAPQPVQFAIPGAIPTFCKKDKRHPSCPPCPPCSCQPCTPSFFSYCSPCHQKCRCKNSNDTPIPLPPSPPIPLPGPAFPMPFPIAGLSSIPSSSQVVIIPYPPEVVPRRHRKERDYSREKHTCEDTNESSDCSNDDKSYESNISSYYYSRKKKNRPYINNGIYERRSGGMRRDDSDKIVIKPELNYLNNNGVVKIKKNLNRGEAIRLMADNDDDRVLKGVRDQTNRRRKHSKMSVLRSRQ